jgi:anion-transporting  ArsA/GET3 family ATPase
MELSELFDKKLIVVTGKGGVGKTAVSLALSYLNSAHGRRPVYTTLEQIERDSYFFGYETGVNEKEQLLDDNISAVSIEPNTALREYIHEHFVTLYPVYAAILKSKTLQTFFEAAPGLKELITIGKVWHLGNRGGKREYDQVIFDAPSTGHAIPILNLPSKVLGMVRGGALREHIEWVEGFLKDPEKTAVVVVAAPEDMVVKETIELIESVESMGINVLLTVVNNVYESEFSKSEEKVIRETSIPEEPGVRAVIETAMDQIERSVTSKKYMKKLRTVSGGRSVSVRRIFKNNLAQADLKNISEEIEEQLTPDS